MSVRRLKTLYTKIFKKTFHIHGKYKMNLVIPKYNKVFVETA